MKTFAFTNQKGGSGKTTSVVNLGSCLSSLNKKVLIIDADSQAHASIHVGLNPTKLQYTLYDILIEDIDPQKVITKTNFKNLDIIPANTRLFSAEVKLAGYQAKELVLKKKLGIINGYDFILFDCPPSLGLITINVLATVGEIIIPVQAEFFALEGTSKILHTLSVVKERLNPDLTIYKVLISRYDKRKNLCKDVAKNIKKHFKEKVFTTIIHDNIKVAEAPSYGEPVNVYFPNSKGSKDYMALAKEIINDKK